MRKLEAGQIDTISLKIMFNPSYEEEKRVDSKPSDLINIFSLHPPRSLRTISPKVLEKHALESQPPPLPPPPPPIMVKKNPLLPPLPPKAGGSALSLKPPTAPQGRASNKSREEASTGEEGLKAIGGGQMKLKPLQLG